MRLKNAHIIWTVYLDSRISRRMGRRLPASECVPGPTLDELRRACERLGLEIVEAKEARYPRVWWLGGGYVAVRKGGEGKRSLLRLVAREVRRLRGGA
ncbi:signal recognition particle [Candidatus Geothermarchaeota archaeon ex4572_27]|nr:MAG: signal recognition particle [Candidatus Geothermarchaeota archaeon ex4572_27]